MRRVPWLVLALVACSAQPSATPEPSPVAALVECPEQARFVGRWAGEELYGWAQGHYSTGSQRSAEIEISLGPDCSLALGGQLGLALDDGELEVRLGPRDGWWIDQLRLGVVSLAGEDYLIGRALQLDTAGYRWSESVLVGTRDGRDLELSRSRCLVDCLLSCEVGFELELDQACARSCEDPSQSHSCAAVAPPTFDLPFERIEALTDTCDGPCEIELVNELVADPSRQKYPLVVARTQTGEGPEAVTIRVGFEDADGWWITEPIYQPSDTVCATRKPLEVWSSSTRPLSSLWPLAGLSLIDWHAEARCVRPPDAPSCDGNGVAPHASATRAGVLACTSDAGPPRCSQVARNSWEYRHWNPCDGQAGQRERVVREHVLHLQAGGRLTLVPNLMQETRRFGG
jgi:hypothetical protein